MLEMDGFQVLSEVKHDQKLNRVKVVILTARGMVNDLERAISPGADACIIKPGDPEFLSKKINSILIHDFQISMEHLNGPKPDRISTLLTKRYGTSWSNQKYLCNLPWSEGA